MAPFVGREPATGSPQPHASGRPVIRRKADRRAMHEARYRMLRPSHRVLPRRLYQSLPETSRSAVRDGRVWRFSLGLGISRSRRRASGDVSAATSHRMTKVRPSCREARESHGFRAPALRGVRSCSARTR